MSVFNTKFKIAQINFNLYSDFDASDMILDIQPYNLNVNYYLDNQFIGNQIVNIYIKHNDSKLNIVEEFEENISFYYIEGDYNPMFKEGYNKQFGLFGNKGIVNRIILHSLEKAGNIILHGCAAINFEKKKVILGIGSSGSGKSVLTSAAIECGWRIVGTEHIIIGSDLTLYKGNSTDNASVQSVNIIKNQLEKAVVFDDKIMTEPTAQKVVVDYKAYMIEQQSVSLSDFELNLVIVSFKNSICSELVEIKDSDFLLRMIQISASEKICTPIIYDDYMLDQKLNGKPKNRVNIINLLIKGSKFNVVFGGDYNSFIRALKSLV